MNPLPPEITRPGPPPVEDRTCTQCGRHYSLHSGATCRLCRAPVEHHDPRDLPEHLAIYADLARARLAGGHDLTDAERYALEHAP